MGGHTSATLGQRAPARAVSVRALDPRTRETTKIIRHKTVDGARARVNRASRRVKSQYLRGKGNFAGAAYITGCRNESSSSLSLFILLYL